MTVSKPQFAKIAIAAALLAVLWANYCFVYARNAGMDFAMFYSVGQMLRQGEAPRLYDIALQREFQVRYSGGLGLSFTPPPITALLFFPFAFTSMQVAYCLWTALSMALFVLCAVLLNRSLRVFRESGWLLLLSFLFLPVHFNFLQGQTDAFVLLAYTLSFILLRSEKPLWAGLALALGLLKFHLVLPMVVIMLLRRQGRFLMGFAAGGALAVAVSVLVFGRAVLVAYPRFLMHLPSMGMAGIDLRAMPNVRGFLHLLLGREPMTVLVAAISLAILLWAAFQWRDVEHGFAVSVTAVLLTSYHLNPHDLLLMLIPLAVWIRKLKWLSWRGLVYASVALPPVAWVAAEMRHLAAMAILLFLLMVVFRSGAPDAESTAKASLAAAAGP